MLADRATFDGLVAIADEAGARLLVDEVYRGLELDEADRLPAGADASPGGVSLGVMSKAYAMAGLRIGWLATRDHDAAGEDRGLQGLHHDLLVGAVRDPVDHRPACPATGCSPARATIVAGNLERLDGFFEDWADRFSWVRPQGRLDRLPAPDRPGRQDRRLGRRAGRGRGRPAAAGVAVRPSRQPFPPGVRPDRPARGARPAGGATRRERCADQPPDRRAPASAQPTAAPRLANAIAKSEPLDPPPAISMTGVGARRAMPTATADGAPGRLPFPLRAAERRP